VLLQQGRSRARRLAKVSTGEVGVTTRRDMTGQESFCSCDGYASASSNSRTQQFSLIGACPSTTEISLIRRIETPGSFLPMKYFVDHQPTSCFTPTYRIIRAPSHPHTFSRNFKHLGCFKDSKEDRVLGKKVICDTLTTVVRTPPKYFAF